MTTRRSRQIVVLAVAVGLLGPFPFGGAVAARAQQLGTPATAALAAAPPSQEVPPERLHLMVGRSLVITSPARLRRVSVADPNIADAIIVSPNQVLINGKTPGGVSLLLWDETDQSQAFDLTVDIDILGLSQKIREVFPQEPVKVEASKDLVMLSGRISSKEIADKILQVVSATSPKVISLMEIPGPPAAAEVLLEVRFAEVNRAAVEQLGANLISVGSDPSGPRSTIGTTRTGQFGSVELRTLETQSGGQLARTEFRFADLLNIFIYRADINLGATIRALEQKNLLQILAEPTLMTQMGKEASFLAGGEFPFPVIQSSVSGNAVTIQFKEFGVRLSFIPTPGADGKIHLKVRPEVSALDFSNALTLAGFLIPALSTRRVEAEMELMEGQSFAIAGLVDDRVIRSLQRVPLLGDIPVLGRFFRSRSVSKTKTELLVLVTPRLVKAYPAAERPAGPQFPAPFLPPAGPDKPAAPPAQP